VRRLTGTFRAVGLDGRGVQITITESVTPEGLGGQIIPGFRLSVLKARRWSLVHTRVPVQGICTEASGAGGDAVGRCRDIATGN